MLSASLIKTVPSSLPLSLMCWCFTFEVVVVACQADVHILRGGCRRLLSRHDGKRLVGFSKTQIKGNTKPNDVQLGQSSKRSIEQFVIGVSERNGEKKYKIKLN